MQLAVAARLGADGADWYPAAATDGSGGIAIVVAFLSASLDIVLDAYRTDVLLRPERGFGAAVVGEWISTGSVAGECRRPGVGRSHWMARHLLALAALMAAGIVTILLSPNPPAGGLPPKTPRSGRIDRCVNSSPGPAFIGLLALIVLYKVGDAVAASLQTAFFIGGLGFPQGGRICERSRHRRHVHRRIGGRHGDGQDSDWPVRSCSLGFSRRCPILAFMLLAWIGKSYEALATSIRHRKCDGWHGHGSLCRAYDVPLRPSLYGDAIRVAVFSGSLRASFFRASLG